MSVDNWALDASVFVNFVNIRRMHTLAAYRKSMSVPDYVFRTELTGANAPRTVREAAIASRDRGHFQLDAITLLDLANLAALSPPRRVDLGEATCAIIAARRGGGVLCDDLNAKNWLSSRYPIAAWECTEEILVGAAHATHLDEYALDECQSTLEQNRYKCSAHLRTLYLQQRLARHGQGT